MRRRTGCAVVLFAACLGAASALAGRAAQACDACVEDKIAATYDWQVVSTAERQGHTVVFSAITGPMGPADAGVKEWLVRRLSALPGVDIGSIRVSLSPPALSFACDLRHRTATAMLAAMNGRLRGSGLQLSLVRAGVPRGVPLTSAAPPNRPRR